jgi:hypothetical protein
VKSSIRKFWQGFESRVHPDDATAFASHPDNTFNTDFPPPAFIGDVDNAPLVILMLGGGYDKKITPTEFPSEADHAEYLDWLRGKRMDVPRNLSTYYTEHPAFRWIQEGRAVIVNAVAYRSPKISTEPQNLKLAKLLPSVNAHRQWLHEEVLPEARNGTRCIVAHRWTLWNFPPKNARGFANVHHSKCPASPYLSNDLMAEVASWLDGQR